MSRNYEVKHDRSLKVVRLFGGIGQHFDGLHFQHATCGTMHHEAYEVESLGLHQKLGVFGLQTGGIRQKSISSGQSDGVLPRSLGVGMMCHCYPLSRSKDLSQHMAMHIVERATTIGEVLQGGDAVFHEKEGENAIF